MVDRYNEEGNQAMGYCMERSLDGDYVKYEDYEALAAKLNDVRMGIGCARGQRTTQYCAEAAQRDEVITKLLATARDAQRHDVGACDAYRRACEIAGRTE